MPTLRSRALRVFVLFVLVMEGRVGTCCPRVLRRRQPERGNAHRVGMNAHPTGSCVARICSVCVGCGKVGWALAAHAFCVERQPERGNVHRVGMNAHPTGSCVTFRLPYPVRRTIWPITSLFGFRAWRSRSESGRGVPNICAAISAAQRGAVASPRLPWAVLA